VARFDRPHFEFPFRLGDDGKVVCVEQDTLEHIHSCESVIVRCPVGFRDDRPEFGWPFPEFQNIPIDTRGLEEALRTFEPRGRANAREYMEAADAAVRGISVDVEVDT
jgi:phage baseplate assembly protein W